MMKSFKDLEKWSGKKNHKISVSHEKKDLTLLSKTLEKLNQEQQIIIKELHYVDYLIDLANNVNPEKTEEPQELFDDYAKYRSWMKELKKTLKKLNNKPKEEVTNGEMEFLLREKARLQSEKKRLEKHLKVVDELIAKNRILLIDVQETYCRELSGGHSIAAVGGILNEKFGNKLVMSYTTGRWKMIKLFEKHYNINRREAVKLLDLLIDAYVVIYNIEMANNFDINFYTPYMDEFINDVELVNEPALGYWIINA